MDVDIRVNTKQLQVLVHQQRIDVVSSLNAIEVVASSAAIPAEVVSPGQIAVEQIAPPSGINSTYPIAPGANVGNGKVVQSINGLLSLASVDDETSPFNTLGVFDASLGKVITAGQFTYTNWNWTVGASLFLGRDGNLVQVPLVDSPFYLQVATVESPTQIQINVQEPIFL